MKQKLRDKGGTNARRLRAGRWAAFSCLLSCLLSGGSDEVRAGTFDLQPRVETRFTLTDNVLLTETDTITDTALILSPGLNYQARGAHLDAAVDYWVDYLVFLNDGTTESRPNGVAVIDYIGLDDRLRLSGRGSLQQSFIDRQQSLSGNIGNRSENRQLIQTYTASAEFTSRIRNVADYTLRYRFGVSLSGADDLDDDSFTTRFSDTTSHEGDITVDTGERFGWLRLRADGRVRRVERSLDVPSFRNDRWSGEIWFRLARSFWLIGSAGYTDNNLQNSDLAEEGFFWESGFRWVPSRRTTFEARYGQVGNRPLWDVSLNHQLTRRVDIRATYVDRISANTIVGNLGLEGFSRDDNLGIVDPSGQPITQVDQPFTLSDIDFRRQAGNVTLNWRDKRNQVFLNSSYERRTFDDDSGVSVSWSGGTGYSHRITRNSDFRAEASYRSNDFEGGDRRDQTILASLSYRKTFSRNVFGDITYNYSQRFSNAEGGDLRENAVTLFLRARF